MKSKSIKFKIVAVISLIICILVAIIAFENVLKFDAYVDSNFNDDVTKASNVFSKKIEDMKKQSLSLGYQLANNREVAKAIEEKNTENILKLLNPLVKGAGIDFVTVTDENGDVLARTHDPNKKGDSVANQENVKEALSGNTNSQIESGTSVKLAARSGVPVKNDNGQVVGVISTGFRLDSNGVVDYINSSLGCETTIFLGDARIATTVKKDGKRAVGTKLDSTISKIVLSNKIYSGEANILGGNYITRYTPIIGPENKVIGILFTGKSKSLSNIVKKQFITNNIAVGIIALLIFGIVIYIYIDKRISKPLKEVVEHFKFVANGKFNVEVSSNLINRKDEIGELASEAGIMQKDLGTLVSKIVGDSEEISASSEELSAAVEEFYSMMQNIDMEINKIVEGTEEINAASEEVNASVEEVNGNINELSKEAEEGSKNSNEFKERAFSVQKNSKAAVEKSNNIYVEKEEKILKAIQDGKVVEKITMMANTVKDITAQINLLSLNASIEAARAGESGKGFAVVATEVGKLADESSVAVEEIQDIVLKVQNAFDNLSNNSKEILEFIQHDVNAQFNMFKNVGTQYNSDSEFVSEMSQKISLMVHEINVSVNQVSLAMQTMTSNTQNSYKNVESIQKSINETSKGIEQVALTAQSQAVLAQKLNEMMQKFEF